MLGGSKITGHTNTSTAGHGAVSIISGGRFTMSGGTITGNTATHPDSFNFATGTPNAYARRAGKNRERFKALYRHG